MIPVVGEAFDAVNGAIYAARGDAANAALSFAACVPVLGNVGTGAKLVAKGVDKVSDAVSIVKKLDNVADDVGIIAKKVHGNFAGNQPATLYARVDQSGNFKKWGVYSRRCKALLKKRTWW